MHKYPPASGRSGGQKSLSHAKKNKTNVARPPKMDLLSENEYFCFHTIFLPSIFTKLLAFKERHGRTGSLVDICAQNKEVSLLAQFCSAEFWLLGL